MSTTFGQFLSALIKKKVVIARTDEEVVTNGKKNFIQVIGSPSGYKNTWMFLKAVLLSMCGSAYPSHFRNFTRNEMMKQFETSNDVGKINDNAFF